MESIATTESSTEFITAEQLRDLTITKEELLEKQRTNILNSFFDSMTKLATEQGSTSYMASLHPQFDVGLLETVTKDLTDLGFIVESKLENEPKIGNYLAVNISWAEAAAENATTETTEVESQEGN